MFNIHMARFYSFCLGVKRAADLAEEMIASAKRPIYSIGKLVHNDTVVSNLEARGLQVLSSPGGHEPGLALIRAHGIPESEEKTFMDAGYTLIDGTCRIVKANHVRCEQSTRPVLYFGIRNHAETLSTASHIRLGYHIIENEEDLDSIDPSIHWNAVVQTTFSSVKQKRFREILASRAVEVDWLNDICPASERRRSSVLDLCEKCDTIIVIGETQSANTSELLNLARMRTPSSFLVPDVGSIEDSMLEKAHDVGVTAGASVSPEQVEEVVSFLVSKGGILLKEEGEK